LAVRQLIYLALLQGQGLPVDPAFAGETPSNIEVSRNNVPLLKRFVIIFNVKGFVKKKQWAA